MSWMLTILNFMYGWFTSRRLVCRYVECTLCPVILMPLLSQVSSLPQEPPAPIGPVLSKAVSKLPPSEVALDTFNSQYLQKHPGSPRATLAFAKALKILGAPVEEIESSLLNLTHPEANLDVKVRLCRHILHLGIHLHSSRLLLRP